MPKIAFHSHTTAALPLEEDVKLARLTGYDGIVCSYAKIREYFQRCSQKELREFVREVGIGVFGIAGIPVDLEHVTEDLVTEIKRFARLVRTMKGNFVSVSFTHGSKEITPATREEVFGEYAGKLALLAEGAAEYGVNLSVEQEKPDPLFSSPVLLTYVISKAGKNNLGFVFDPFAWYRAGISIEEMETAESIFHVVYMADVPDKKVLREKDRLIPGEGILDFERLLKVIRICEFKGVFALKLSCGFRTKTRNRKLLRSAREPIEAYLEIMEHL